MDALDPRRVAWRTFNEFERRPDVRMLGLCVVGLACGREVIAPALGSKVGGWLSDLAFTAGLSFSF